MIFNNGCKCFVEHDPLHVANVQHPSESVTRDYCENQEGSEQDPMLCRGYTATGNIVVVIVRKAEL